MKYVNVKQSMQIEVHEEEGVCRALQTRTNKSIDILLSEIEYVKKAFDNIGTKNICYDVEGQKFEIIVHNKSPWELYHFTIVQFNKHIINVNLTKFDIHNLLSILSAYCDAETYEEVLLAC